MSETNSAPTQPVTPTPSAENKAPEIKSQASVEQPIKVSSPEALEAAMDEQGLTEKEKKSLRKKFEIKVDGETYVEELDLEDEEAVKKHLQMSKAAQKRMKESAQLKRDVETFFKALQGDTKNVLSELGIDPKKFAEQIIEEEMKEMEKSPEQKEKEKLMKELEDMKNKLKAEEEAKKTAEMQRMQEKFALDLDKDISEGLSKSKLPKSPYVVKRIAEGLILAHKNGYTKATAKDIIPLVEKDILSEIQGMFGAAPEDALEAIVGKDNIEKLRKRRVNKAVESASTIKPTGNELKPDLPKKKMTMKEFFHGKK